jgi:hypothetical protein
MSDSQASEYKSTFRNTPFHVLSLLAVLLAAAGAGAAAIKLLPSQDLMLPILEIAGATIVAIVLLTFAAYSQRVWQLGDRGVRIQQTPRLSWLPGARDQDIPYTEIVALRRVESGFDVMLEIETRSGARFAIMQALFKNNVGVYQQDVNGLYAFANAVRQRVAAVEGASASFLDGLGFWNRPFGLGVQVVMLALTLGLSSLILYGFYSGAHMPQGAAMQGLGLVLLLPVGVVYSLYRSWSRRSFVLGLHRLRDKITVKP